MSIIITVEVGSEHRVYTADGDACHLALSGLPGDGPVAYLGHDRGELFIQPSEERSAAAALTCNGVPLTASRWLGDGDEIGVGRHRLRCQTSGGSTHLALVQPDVESSREDDAVSVSVHVLCSRPQSLPCSPQAPGMSSPPARFAWRPLLRQKLSKSVEVG